LHRKKDAPTLQVQIGRNLLEPAGRISTPPNLRNASALVIFFE
jgi:hypothetical protein